MKAQIQAKTRNRGCNWAIFRCPHEKKDCWEPHRVCGWRCSNILARHHADAQEKPVSLASASGQQHGSVSNGWSSTKATAHFIKTGFQEHTLPGASLHRQLRLESIALRGCSSHMGQPIRYFLFIIYFDFFFFLLFLFYFFFIFLKA
jgi:hypothetical protein